MVMKRRGTMIKISTRSAGLLVSRMPSTSANYFIHEDFPQKISLLLIGDTYSLYTMQTKTWDLN